MSLIDRLIEHPFGIDESAADDTEIGELMSWGWVEDCGSWGTSSYRLSPRGRRALGLEPLKWPSLLDMFKGLFRA